MGSGSKETKAAMEADAAAKRRAEEKVYQDSPELLQWRGDMKSFKDWLAKKDYRNGPTGSILNFDLMSPAVLERQQSQLANLEGVGAASMAGSGDNSIAVKQMRERMANENAQNAGAAYEQAVKGQDAYYSGNLLPFMQAENSRWGNVFGQTSANASNSLSAYQQAKAARMQMIGNIVGAGVQGALGFAGKFVKPR